MENTKNLNFQFNISLFFRILRKNMAMFIMSAIAVALGFYLFGYYSGSTSYTAKCDLVVISQNSNYNGDYYVSIALNEFKSILNSDAMKNQVVAELESDGNSIDNVNVSADVITDSNMITLSAQAGTPQEAYKVLKASINAYRSLIKKSGNGISLEVLGEISSSSIEISEHNSASKAAIALEFVIFFELLAILLSTIFRDRIQNAAQVDQMLDTTCVGTVYFEKKHKKEKSILITHPNVSGFYIDNLGKIATKIAYKLKQNDENIFMVTSACENEGKTTVAANLAITLAKRGNKVLLVDMDLKQPAVYKVFDMQEKKVPTIIDYLLGEKEYEDVIIPGKTENMYFCLGYDKVRNSDQLLESERLERFIQKAKNEMDYVIIDTAPCGVVGDTYFLCKLVPDVLLVIWQDKVKIQMLNDCLDELNSAGGRSIGAVVNGVVSSDSSIEKRIVGDNYAGL